MTRPSQNIDRILLAVGVEMVMEGGISGLNIRELVRRAGVNLGMFHYHFKTKDTFTRRVLQEVYDSVFAELKELAATPDARAIDQLQKVLRKVARFSRDNRDFFVNLLTDLGGGSPVVMEFTVANFPRHAALVYKLVLRGQEEGTIARMPPAVVLAFIASTVMGPGLMGGMLARVGKTGSVEATSLASDFRNSVLSDDAIELRLQMLFKAIAS